MDFTLCPLCLNLDSEINMKRFLLKYVLCFVWIVQYKYWEEEVHPTTRHNAAAHTAAVHYANDFGRRTGAII